MTTAKVPDMAAQLQGMFGTPWGFVSAKIKLLTVLVAELWEGPEKECAHRCLTAGECGYNLASSHMKDYAQQIAQLG